MTNSLLLLSLLFLAIVIGWLLGYFSAKKRSWVKEYSVKKGLAKEESVNKSTHSDSKIVQQPTFYLQGVNYLMIDRPDRAVDIFLQSLPVNLETLDTYIAMGNLLRGNGEVEKAVKVHEHLLTHSKIGEAAQQLAQFELARDFYAAGLYDRSESILQRMVEGNTAYRQQCLLLLVDIYRDEKDWQKALHAAELLNKPNFSLSFFNKDSADLPSLKEIDLKIGKIHFCCELAEAAFIKEDFLTARHWIKQAFNFDKKSVRASLLWARLQLAKQQYADSIKILKKIIKQHKEVTTEILDLLTLCYQEIDDYPGYQKFLLQCFTEIDSVPLMLKIVENIDASEGSSSALDFITEQLTERPSLRGVQRLLEMRMNSTAANKPELVSSGSLNLIQALLEKILSNRPAYRCGHCGFAGKELHWLCPGCKTWESVHLIQGIEGE